MEQNSMYDTFMDFEKDGVIDTQLVDTEILKLSSK